jgi:ceramide glucosyltransferase
MALAAEIILFALAGAGTLYNLFAALCVMRFFSRKEKKPPAAAAYPPVSILKPLKGRDFELKENLQSFCQQDYPEYEVLLGMAGAVDGAAPIAREIAALYPGKARYILTGTDHHGANSKVTNLAGLSGHARYGLLAVSDSDMRVGRDYLKRIVSEYLHEKGTGLVTSLYKISQPASAGSVFESLTIAADFIPSVLVAEKLEGGLTFGLGASMLLSREHLRETGGFEALKDYLGDDYQLGNRIAMKGHGVVLSGCVVEDMNTEMGFGNYITHQLRWSRTYRASRPRGYLGYGITHALFWSLLLLALFPSAAALLVAAAAYGVRLALACRMRTILSLQIRPLFLFVPAMDIMAFFIWVWSFLGKKVSWRGSRYSIEKGGKIKEI